MRCEIDVNVFTKSTHDTKKREQNVSYFSTHASAPCLDAGQGRMIHTCTPGHHWKPRDTLRYSELQFFVRLANLGSNETNWHENGVNWSKELNSCLHTGEDR